MRSMNVMEDKSKQKRSVSKQRLDLYVCPLAKKIMRDPVAIRQISLEHGENVTKAYVFEREAIVQYVKDAYQSSQTTTYVKISNQTVRIIISQVIKTDYTTIEIASTTSLPALLEENKVYTTKGNYYMLDPAGARKQGIFDCNANFTQEQKNICAAITTNGHNMFLIADLSKRREINQFLKEYPKFWKCDAVYFPKNWQEELSSLICQQNPDDTTAHLDRIKICLDKDPRLLTAKLGQEKITACSLACIYATPEIVFFLIQKLNKTKNIQSIIEEGMLEQVNNIGNTPLHAAAASGHCELAAVLLEYQAKVDLKNIDGNTPVHLAVQNSHLELLEILLGHTADVTIKNNIYQTAIAMELLKTLTTPPNLWQATDTLKVLLEKLAKQKDFEHLDLNSLVAKANYEFPLHLSIIIKDYDLLDALLAKTPPKPLKVLLNQSPYLYLAALQNDVTAMTILLEAGANSKVLGGEEDTVLHVAVQHDHADVLQWLFRDNHMIVISIINTQNLAGNTALHIAVTKKNIPLATKLTINGARITLANNQGQTSTDLTDDSKFISLLKNTAENYQYATIADLQADALVRGKQMAELQEQFTPGVALSFSRLSGTAIDFNDPVEFKWQHPLANGHFASYMNNVITIKIPQSNITTYSSSDNNWSPKCISVLSDNKLATVCSKQIISIREVDNNRYREPLICLVGHNSTVQCLQEINPLCLASSDSSGEIKIWSLKSGRCMHTIPQKNLSVQCFSATKNITILACGAADGEVQLFNLDNFGNSDTFFTEKYTLPITSLQILTNELLAIGFQDGTINILNLKTFWLDMHIPGKLTWEMTDSTTAIPGHTTEVQCITIFNSKMVSCSANEIKIWDLHTFACNDTIASNEGEKFHMFHYANGIRVIRQEDRTITFLSLEELINQFRLAQAAALQGWIPYLLGYKPSI